MRYFLRAAAALVVLFPLLANGAGAAASAGPVIARVSLILPQPQQRITISGSGFGRLRSYGGDSYFIRIRDESAHWNAGFAGDRPFDKVGLAVLLWSDRRIVLGGFRGAYGRHRWRLHPGDRLVIEIWNPQTRAGPATFKTTVAAAA